MDALLAEALAAKRPIRLSAIGEVSSVALLVPEQGPDNSIVFSMSNDDTRYLRIVKNGKVDLNGRKNGPWTLFSVRSAESNGSVTVHGIKSGRYLLINTGEFASDAEARPLQIEPSLKKARVAEGLGDSPGVTLHTVEGLCLARTVRLQRLPNGDVLLATDSGNLACSAEKKMHWKGGQGQWARWQIEQRPLGFAFRHVGHSSPGHASFLALSPHGEPFLSETPAMFADVDGAVQARSQPQARQIDPVDKSVLSDRDLKEFKENGYVIVREAIPLELVRKALRSINNQLGKPDCWEADPNPLNAAQLSLKLGSMQNGGQNIIEDILYRSPRFWSAVNILLGDGNLQSATGIQVALRFPQPLAAGPLDKEDIRLGTQYHIDGMGQNRLCPFSLLCGVALSDQLRPSCGNLHVFPGSHLLYELHEYYKKYINDDDQGEADDSERKPNLGESQQVLLRQGDVVIAHQLLAHRVGINYSENIRYQLYYRLKHKDHENFKAIIVDDPWAEFDTKIRNI